MPRSPGVALARLVAIMRRLRGPRGCPWDREQTLQTLKPFVLEEAYEVVDAIERGTPAELRDELGDLVFEAVFLAELCSETGAFTIGDAIASVNEKLIRRHPHIFKPSRHRPQGITTPGAVVTQWEDIKRQERRAAGKNDLGPLEGIPAALPALPRAYRIGRTVAKVGFDWPSAARVVDKLREELGELEHAAASGDAAHTAEELGDLLFVVANLARKLGVDPEDALRGANRKFERRFTAMTMMLTASGRALEAHSLDEMEQAWAAVKAQERPRSAAAPAGGARAGHDGQAPTPSRRRTRR